MTQAKTKKSSPASLQNLLKGNDAMLAARAKKANAGVERANAQADRAAKARDEVDAQVAEQLAALPEGVRGSALIKQSLKNRVRLQRTLDLLLDTIEAAGETASSRKLETAIKQFRAVESITRALLEMESRHAARADSDNRPTFEEWVKQHTGGNTQPPKEELESLAQTAPKVMETSPTRPEAEVLTPAKQQEVSTKSYGGKLDGKPTHVSRLTQDILDEFRKDEHMWLGSNTSLQHSGWRGGAAVINGVFYEGPSSPGGPLRWTVVNKGRLR